MDLTLVANEPLEITAAGRTYRFRAATVRQMARLQAWVAAQPPPRAARPPLPEGTDAATANLIRAAQAKAEAALRREWPPEPGSLEVWKFVASSEAGQAKLLELAMAKGDPNATAEGVDALLDALEWPQLQVIGLRFFGWDAETEDAKKKREAETAATDGTGPAPETSPTTDGPAAPTGATP